MKSISAAAPCANGTISTPPRRNSAALALSDGPATPPFHLLRARHHRRRTARLFRILDARRFGGRAAAREPCHGFDLRHPQRAIRVGYLSNDFHDHATALLLIETLEAHDRARFECAPTPMAPSTARRCARGCWAPSTRSPTSQLTDAEAARPSPRRRRYSDRPQGLHP